MFHLPEASTTAVPITSPAGFLMVMVSPGVPVPLRVGLLVLVMLSPLTPESVLGSSTPCGASGAEVSMVTGSGAGGLTLPAGSVAVMTRLLRPSGSGVLGVMLHLPAASTTAVPITLPRGSLMVMVSPGVPVPIRLGVLSLVVLSPLTPESVRGSSSPVGADGPVVSIVTGSGAAGLTLPDGSVAVML